MKIVSFSGGKDSTAMLLRLLELGEEIDEIVFADTGFEFPELYDYIKRVEDHIGRTIKTIHPPKELFKKWFYGKVTRGKHKGKVRGFPLQTAHCWWMRESKHLPLMKAQEDADIVYIGIAYDEKQRMSSKDNNLRYPLVDWKWTEKDCIDYLNKKGMFNPLYVNFNRLGCYFCPKQSQSSLYVLWKNYPELWVKAKWWCEENQRVIGKTLKEKYSLQELEDKFNKGFVPKIRPKYECSEGCEGMKYAFIDKQCKLEWGEL